MADITIAKEELKSSIDFLQALKSRLAQSSEINGNPEVSSYLKGYFDGETKRMFDQFNSDFNFLVDDIVEIFDSIEREPK